MQFRSDRAPAVRDRPEARTPRRAADAVVEILVDAGVRVVFGIPGGTIAPIFDALLDHPEVRVITTRHEGGALFAAAGYARSSGQLAVALVTSGPGVLNAITGLASAFCDGLPVLLLAGEVPRKLHGRGALQEGSAHGLNILSMVSSISKLAVEVTDTNLAPALVRRAIATAMSGRRGPVVMTLPIDTLAAPIGSSDVALNVETRFVLASTAIERVASLVRSSPRTVLLAGSGVRHDGGPAALLSCAERMQLPVITTPKGKGVFPEHHPLALGVFGLGGHPSATDYIEQGADLVIAVGTSLGDLATNGWNPGLVGANGLIHVDIDGRQIGRAYQTRLGIVAPAADFFTALSSRFDPETPIAKYGISHHDDAEKLLLGSEQLVSAPRALWEIQRSLPDDTLFTCDSGEHFCFAVHYIRSRHPDGFLSMCGLGSMGSGICGALGAQLAFPDRTVVAICGDGGFAMTGAELATAVAENLPIVFMVLNDERLGMVELGNSKIYGRTPRYPTGPTSIEHLARSMGARAITIHQPGEIEAIDFAALRAQGPLVLDVHIDRSIKMPKHGRFEALGNAQQRKLLN